MHKTTFILFCLLTTSLHSIAQTTESGDINQRIASIISSMPGNSGDNYESPSNNELNAWHTLIGHILSGAYSTANSQANQLGYQLIAFTDNTSSPNQLYYMLEEQPGNNKYWGTYVFNPTPRRSQLVIQSPHPRADLNTGKEGIWVFHRLQALAFCLSGSHRCNHSTLSSCSGTTSICGSSSPYRISDMPHVDNSIYHQTTISILQNAPGSYFVQLHGFGQRVDDPELIMSNGTRQSPSPDPIVELRNGLTIADPSLNFKIAHLDMTWNRLIGFTNTQGRMINSSANPCNTSASVTNGQFLHVEQASAPLRADTTGWNKMVDGLANAFAEDSLPLELLEFGSRRESTGVVLYWTVAEQSDVLQYELERSTQPNQFKTIYVQDIKEQPLPYTYQYIDQEASPSTQYYRLKTLFVNGYYEYSAIIVEAALLADEQFGVYPNPFNKRLQVVLPDNRQLYHISILDVLGRSIIEVQEQGPKVELSIQNAHHLYYLVVRSMAGEVLFHQKLIAQ
ncbi:MAG: hypothetical protein AAFP19_18015 [Bacteroidota bacterium]